MTEIPILFSGPMVRAILAGTKQQTRRLVGDRKRVGERPYGAAGDRLWVRETWRKSPVASGGVLYAADVSDDLREKGRWCPAIFMRRADSRIDLEIVHIHIEPLQDIRAEDARAEGVQRPRCSCVACSTAHVLAFAAAWDRIYGARAPWSSNPWVWAITFRRVRP